MRAVEGAARDEVADAVRSTEEDDVLDEKEDSEGVRDTGEKSAASAA